MASDQDDELWPCSCSACTERVEYTPDNPELLCALCRVTCAHVPEELGGRALRHLVQWTRHRTMRALEFIGDDPAYWMPRIEAVGSLRAAMRFEAEVRALDAGFARALEADPC